MKLATFLLHNSVEDWWVLHAARAGGIGLVTWEEFRKTFKDKFYSNSFFDVKRNKSMNLVQGDMTVVEYEK